MSVTATPMHVGMSHSFNHDLELHDESRMNEYDVGKAIGKGKFSVVYKAYSKVLCKPCAMKKIAIFDIMDEKSREKCLKEVRLLRNLKHPNIVSYLDSFIDANELIIVFEWADAGDLKRQIRKANERHQRFDERLIWKYFSQICDAISYMHQQRVIHRDIKPANIFLMADGTVKVGDLGLGRYLSEQTMEAFSKVGTPLYMSPEVLKAKGYDWRSDIWSLGCILYELAVLRSPFKEQGLNLYGLFQKINKGTYPAIPEYYSAQLRSLVDSMISLDPSHRPGMHEIHTTSKQMFAHFNALRKKQQQTSKSQQQTPKQQEAPENQENLANATNNQPVKRGQPLKHPEPAQVHPRNSRATKNHVPAVQNASTMGKEASENIPPVNRRGPSPPGKPSHTRASLRSNQVAPSTLSNSASASLKQRQVVLGESKRAHNVANEAVNVQANNHVNQMGTNQVATNQASPDHQNAQANPTPNYRVNHPGHVHVKQIRLVGDRERPPPREDKASRPENHAPNRETVPGAHSLSEEHQENRAMNQQSHPPSANQTDHQSAAKHAKGGGSPANSNRRRMVAETNTMIHQAECVVERLKILNYDVECDKRSLSFLQFVYPLSQLGYWDRRVNRSVQFQEFLHVACWLLGALGQDPAIDPLSSPQMATTQLLNRVHAIGDVCPMEFIQFVKPTQLTPGFGPGVCLVLFWLTDAALKIRGIVLDSPVYADDQYLPESLIPEDEEVAGFGDVDEEEDSDSDDEIFAMEQALNHETSGEFDTPRSHIEAPGADSPQVALWYQELERLAPQLKEKAQRVFQCPTDRSWHVRLNQAVQHNQQMRAFGFAAQNEQQVDRNGHATKDQLNNQVKMHLTEFGARVCEELNRISHGESRLSKVHRDICEDQRKLASQLQALYTSDALTQASVEDHLVEFERIQELVVEARTQVKSQEDSVCKTDAIVTMKAALRELKRENKGFLCKIQYAQSRLARRYEMDAESSKDRW